jgi:prophage regulatory protein
MVYVTYKIPITLQPVTAICYWLPLVATAAKDKKTRTTMPSTPTNQTDRILRPREAAAKLGCDRSTLYRWVKAGILKKAIRVGIESTGWRESDLDAFLAEREAAGNAVEAHRHEN